MNEHLQKPEEIIGEFFKSVQRYIQNLIVTKENLMDGLYNFANEAWKVPKKYKGNSSQMGFIPEYLVFESVRQFIERNSNISFLPYVRSKTWDGKIETYYFVNDLNDPCCLLSQGLSIRDTSLAKLGLPYIKYFHDIVYLVKKKRWNVKAIFETKGYFEFPGLKGDIDRLIFAEKNYPLEDNYALVFVGFKPQDLLTKKEKELTSAFTKEKNHFCVIPGEKDPELRNSLLEEVLNFMS